MSRVAIERSLVPYLRKIQEFPLVTCEEEYSLIKRWREAKDSRALDRLVTSHLRLAAKIATRYRGYGLPLSDLISEGTIGIFHALRHFDPDRGNRFSSYAIWWIRAAIREYVLHSWSLIKIGTTTAQKKLFFNLGRLKRELGASGTILSADDVKAIAVELAVSETEVVTMNGRLTASHISLNAFLSEENEGRPTEWVDRLADNILDQELMVIDRIELKHRRQLLQAALDCLSSRERAVLFARRLVENHATLRELGLRYGVSPESIRQTEGRAIDKLRKAVGGATLIPRQYR